MKPAFPKPKSLKIRKVKTPTAKKMRQELDLMLKNHIHERDGWKCVCCGNTTQLASCHVLSKGRHSRLRFEPENLITLDWKCHMEFNHKDPLVFNDWFVEKYPGRKERLLIADRNSPKVDLKLLLVYWRDVSGS